MGPGVHILSEARTESVEVPIIVFGLEAKHPCCPARLFDVDPVNTHTPDTLAPLATLTFTSRVSAGTPGGFLFPSFYLSHCLFHGYLATLDGLEAYLANLTSLEDLFSGKDNLRWRTVFLV